LKNQSRYIALAICVCLYALFFWWVGIRHLQYQEGWGTFYFSQYFVEDVLSRDGAVNVIRLFLLQFFAIPWHGAAVLILIMTIFTILIMCIESKIVGNKNKLKSLPILSSLISLASAVLLAMFVGNMSFNKTLGLQGEAGKSEEFYRKLSILTRDSQWESIITECNDHAPVGNLLHQNCLNMAFAETGQLGEHLTDQPVVDIRSIYVDEIQSPQIAAMLSDIYFSMGHIAQSQRYAFEANEKMNNQSPRMLQRLIQTNIIYGQYEVAKKYLCVLSETIYYKEWCEEHTKLLNDKAVESNQLLSMKRKCLIKDNRFSGIKGLDNDLLDIARNTQGTPQCKITLNYLGSLYILAGYQQQFISMIDEFAGSEALPKPLPKCFEEYYNHLRNQ